MAIINPGDRIVWERGYKWHSRFIYRENRGVFLSIVKHRKSYWRWPRARQLVNIQLDSTKTTVRAFMVDIRKE